ncbi:hypothetical protein [Salinicola endophyticus]|uniref:hypothetical protein n=1 Tax=Salinicola endophyticus TaxID=1949083 RepID=UPI0013006DB3|nr:hypothetical protein [Salinicola endophyticus]
MKYTAAGLTALALLCLAPSAGAASTPYGNACQLLGQCGAPDTAWGESLHLGMPMASARATYQAFLKDYRESHAPGATLYETPPQAAASDAPAALSYSLYATPLSPEEEADPSLRRQRHPLYKANLLGDADGDMIELSITRRYGDPEASSMAALADAPLLEAARKDDAEQFGPPTCQTDTLQLWLFDKNAAPIPAARVASADCKRLSTMALVPYMPSDEATAVMADVGAFITAIYYPAPDDAGHFRLSSDSLIVGDYVALKQKAGRR